jgi:hypothetical protein
MILNDKLQILVEGEDVFYSILMSHGFPGESRSNSLTLSKCTNKASIQN